MITVADVVEYLSLDDVTITEADATSALAAIDQESLLAAHQALLVADIWDRDSPINDVPAEKVLQLRTDIADIADGDVALVRDLTGRVLIFQPHEPWADGETVIPVGEGLARAKALADAQALSAANAETLRQVALALTT